MVEWLAVTALCAGFAAAATAQGWLWRLDQVFYDSFLLQRDQPAPRDVVIVAIDDRSLEEIGRWPWNRAVHALLLQRLTEAGSAAVALDIILSEPSDGDGDAVLAAAIAAHGKVVLPVIHAAYGARGDGEAPPLPRLAAAAAAVGHIHIELDPDGIARGVYLWEGFRTPRRPQLALALLGLSAPQRAAPYLDLVFPPDGPGWRRAAPLRIPFVGPPGTFRYVSYVDVLRNEVPPERLRDAVVLVGATATGMGDTVPTPTSGHARPMPGVEVHATIFNALREGTAIHPLPDLLAASAALLAVTGLMLVMLRATPRVALLAAFSAAALSLLGAMLLLLAGLYWFPPVSTALACLLAYPLWSWRRLESAGRHLDAELQLLRSADAPFGLPAPEEEERATPDRFGARIAAVRNAASSRRVLQRFIAQVLDGLPVGCVVLDPDGVVRLANREAHQLLATRNPLQVRKALARLEPDIAQAHALGDAEQREVELPDGRTLLLSGAPLPAEDGRRLGTLVGLMEITAVRAAQRSREETLYFLSHDLRTPLTAILSLLTNPAPPHDAPQRLERRTRSALRLLDDLFRMVRAENIKATDLQTLALEALIQDAVEEVWDTAREKGITLTTPPLSGEEEAPPLVRGESDLLTRALANLLTNAVKYTPPDGRVDIALEASAEHWVIHVRDSGIGISDELQARLFLPFSRLPTEENRRVGGVGLGLRMVRAVAERHGGSVEVASTPGAGSRFTLRLPKAREPAHASAPAT
ncbi:CHASE2 domain-containing protein [Endothiovibrio diazotrophicus]